MSFVDGSKRDKESTEMFVHTKGQGWTKMTQITGQLKRKIEEVRKAGLLLTELPKDKKQPSLLGRLPRHSVNNAVKVASRTGGKISNT